MPTIFFDFDSTVVGKESLDEVIALALANAPENEQKNLRQQVEEITAAGMGGILPFTESLQRRLAVAALHDEHFTQIGDALIADITPDVPELIAELQAKRYQIYIVSGGFRPCLLSTAVKLGIAPERVFANTYQTDQNGIVTGPDQGNPCFTNEGKVPVIQHIVTTEQPPRPYVMIGDGSNDLRAYTAGVVDHFCGFTAHVERAIIQAQAPQQAASVAELRNFISNLSAV